MRRAKVYPFLIVTVFNLCLNRLFAETNPDTSFIQSVKPEAHYPLNILIYKDTVKGWKNNNVIKFNTVGLFFDFYSFSYERVLSDKFSAMVTWGNGKTRNYSDYDGRLYAQYTEEHVTVKKDWSVEFRYYLSHKHTRLPRGFHAGTALYFTNLSNESVHFDYQGVEMSRHTTNYNITSVNLSIGPQFLIKKVVAIDFILAPGYGFITSIENNNSQINYYSYAGWTIRYAIQLGIAFGK